jgi:hypothetical protein
MCAHYPIGLTISVWYARTGKATDVDSLKILSFHSGMDGLIKFWPLHSGVKNLRKTNINNA